MPGLTGYRKGVTRRCPGAATQSAPDGSNPCVIGEPTCSAEDSRVTRRLATLLVCVCGLAATLVALGAGATGGGERGYRVDAIFDNADFLVPGQDVKIAGAVVGSVSGVHLTKRPPGARGDARSRRASRRSASDASCTIRPQSLIGEKFVDC